MLNRCALYGNNGLGGTVRTKQVAGCGTFVVSQKSSNRDLGKGENERSPGSLLTQGFTLEKMAASYSPALHCSTIGASGLNFSVRNGKRWDPAAITT